MTLHFGKNWKNVDLIDLYFFTLFSDPFYFNI